VYFDAAVGLINKNPKRPLLGDLT